MPSELAEVAVASFRVLRGLFQSADAEKMNLLGENFGNGNDSRPAVFQEQTIFTRGYGFPGG
jgi:hypothetical protein